jgi:hypothetical protein
VVKITAAARNLIFRADEDDNLLLIGGIVPYCLELKHLRAWDKEALNEAQKKIQHPLLGN